MKLIKLTQSVSYLTVVAAFASTAHAQSVDSAEDAGTGIQEIVVTAQKRAESLSKTAAAISVIGQTSMDSIGARSFKDAVSALPNVSASGLGGSIAIRGLGTNTLSASNGTVAYHIDGIFQNSTNQSAATLYDVSRIEVLRGPQGTLYGRNATAGVVNVITNNANTEKFEAFGDASYGNWDSLLLRGAVNVPVTDSFALRLTGTYEKSDDWKHLANGDHPPSKDVLNLRLAWRAQPTDRITWDGRISYTRNNSILITAVPTYLYNASNGTFIRSSNPRDLIALPPGTGTDGLGLNVPGFGTLPSVYKGLSFKEANTQNVRAVDFRSNLNFELSDAFSLTYLLGYAREKNDAGVIGGLLPYQVNYAFPVKSNAWSHELNLNYNSEKLHAILGVYSFQNVHNQRDQLTRLFQPKMENGFISYDDPVVEVGTAFHGPDKSTTRAVFGQATFDVTDRFRVTGGARYNWDRVSFASATTSRCPFGSGLSGIQPNEATVPPSFAALGFPAGTPLCTAFTLIQPDDFSLDVFRPGGAKSFEKFSWKGTAEYDLAPDTMVYATVATGYKAGGVGDPAAIGDARFFRPENNINYEAGIRSKLFDNTLSLNLTAFWTDYKDLQIQSTTPSLPGQLISINAGKSRSRGLELEYVWAPTSADRINGYLSYLDAKFRDFPGQDNLTGISQNFAGKRLPGAPEFSGRVSYSHIFDLGSAGTITPTASVFYQTKTYVSFSNNLPSRVPAYSRSDLIIRYETEGKNFSVEGFVNNIENKLILQQMFPEFKVSNAYYSQPRSYGIRLGFRY